METKIYCDRCNQIVDGKQTKYNTGLKKKIPVTKCPICESIVDWGDYEPGRLRGELRGGCLHGLAL